jgi:glycosyltransferase involved in cell wall biosynthesis
VRIGFIVNEVDGGWSPKDTRLGGTEESIVRWAEELTSRGNLVSVYRCRDDFTHNGVEYYRNIYQGSNDVCVNIKSSEIVPVEPTIYLTNETDAPNLDLSAYDAIVWPSEWAKDNISVNNGNVLVVPHGYDETKIYPGEKVKKRCLYASSPDRGLETLAQIWPSVVEAHPNAELIVTYGGQIFTPNTTCVGSISEDEMNELYRTSDIWVHPCSSGELFGITGIKAQAAGAIPVYFPTMALSETVKAGIPCTDARDMYTKLVQLLGDEDAKASYREQLLKLELPTWKLSTDMLEEVLLDLTT